MLARAKLALHAWELALLPVGFYLAALVLQACR